jgi:hypothetical protein
VVVDVGGLDILLGPDEALLLARKLTEAAVASIDQDVRAESLWGVIGTRRMENYRTPG